MSDLEKTLGYFNRSGDLTFLLWIFGATLALIFLFMIARLVRNLTSGRVHQIREFGMDFDSVADMLDKGLLSKEEAGRVKSVLARRFQAHFDKKPAPTLAELEVEALSPPPGVPDSPSPGAPASPPSVASAATLSGAPASKPQGAGIAPAARPQVAGAKPARPTVREQPRPRPAAPAANRPPAGRPAAAGPSSAPSAPEAKDSQLPIDVLDMYRAGMISSDELEALRRFYAERARQKR
jgi:hypothetical protein